MTTPILMIHVDANKDVLLFAIILHLKLICSSSNNAKSVVVKGASPILLFL